MTERPRKKGLYGAVPLAHHFLASRVSAGDVVVDATCGNGGDTVILARLVGPSGRVIACDIDPAALAATDACLRAEGLRERVELVQRGHERLVDFVSPGITAATFNLGYLPRGEKVTTTAADSTCAALEHAVRLLAPGGVVTVSLYTGHPGGDEEAAAVLAWAQSLDPHFFNVWHSRQLNRSVAAPSLVVIEKTREQPLPQE